MEERHQRRAPTSGAACLAVALQALALPATAQDAPAAGTGDASPPKGTLAIQQITVTAEKRGERLSRVPASVTALSGATLEASGANGIGDVASLVPGVSVTGGGQGLGTVTMRGINAGAEPSPLVGIVVDGVPNGSSSSFALGGLTQLDLGLWDLERLEVLKGPQGTLYGASSMGGLLSYVTREPGLRATEAELELGAGSIDGGATTRSAKGLVNLPLLPGRLALRVAVTAQRDDGWLDNPRLGTGAVNAVSQDSARVSLGAAPAEGLKLRLTAYHQRTERDSSNTVLYDRQSGQPVYPPRGQGLWHPEPNTVQFRQLSLHVDYRLPFANLVSITSQGRTDLEARADYTVNVLGQAGPLFGAASTTADADLRVDKRVQELRLVSPDRPGLQWQVGLFYTREEPRLRQRVVGRRADGTALPPLDPVLETNPQDSEYTERAAFGSVTFGLAPRIDATLGLRRAFIDQGFRLGIAAPLLGIAIAPDPAASSETHTSYLANLRYLLDANRMFFVRAASGYRPGGPNVAVEAAPPTFKTDSLWNYELGYKGSAWDGRLDLSLSAFRIDWSDIQIFGTDRGLSFRENGGRARSQGAELAATWLATPNWRNGLSVAYTDARLRSDVPSFGRAGEKLPNSPRWSAALNSEYVWPVGAAMDARLGLSVRHVGRRHSSFAEVASLPDYTLPGYTLADLRVSLNGPHWALTAYVQNLADATAQVAGSTVATGASPYAQVTLARPRTVGLTLRVSR